MKCPILGTCFLQADNRIFILTWALSFCGGRVGVNSEDLEREKEKAWERLCHESGWVCRICGEAPQCGQQFGNLLGICAPAVGK
jgi:hypothetical protein